MRIPTAVTTAVALATALPAGLAAQMLIISTSGTASATVSAVQGGSRVPLGKVLPSQPLSVDLTRAIPAAKGQTIRGYFDSDGAGNRGFVIIPEGEHDARCTATTPQASMSAIQDQCSLVTVFRGGESARFGADLRGGVVTLRTREPEWRRFRAGAEFGRASFNKLEDVACNSQMIAGLSGCGVDDTAPWYGGFIDYRLTGAISLSASYHRTRYSVTQQYDAQPIRHDVRVNVFDVRAQVDIGDGPIVPYFFAGPAWYDNDSDFGPPPDLGQTRSEGGIRLGGGAGVRFRLGDLLGVRASALYDTGGAHDADTGSRLAIGAYMRF